MIEQALRPATLRDLKTGLHGELICPHDDGYDAARKVWNGMIDKYPALIVRCADQTDVINSIRFAQSQRLPVAMRSGGHSLAGISVCDGGLVIDLSPMKGVIIDPNRRRARVQAGLTLGEFVQATQTFGLATTTGTVAGTGLAGLTLGGGLGWFMGKYGLTIDNLLSVDLVTADGQSLRTSETSHPDLFWAVRGGGGNFGVATSFEFQLHPVGPLLAGKLVYPMTKAREVLRFYREYTSTAPDELTAYASLSTTPTGLPVIALNLCYCGSLDKGQPRDACRVWLAAHVAVFTDPAPACPRRRQPRASDRDRLCAPWRVLRHLHPGRVGCRRSEPPRSAYRLDPRMLEGVGTISHQRDLRQLSGPRGRGTRASRLRRQLRTAGLPQKQI